MKKTRLDKKINMAFQSGKSKKLVRYVLSHIVHRCGTLMETEEEAIEDEITLLVEKFLLREAINNAAAARRATEKLQLEEQSP